MLEVDFGHLGHYNLLVSAFTGWLASLRFKLGIIRFRPVCPQFLRLPSQAFVVVGVFIDGS